MAEFKSFSTLVVASLCAGVALTSLRVRDMVEVASWALGYPVFWHELADPATEARLSVAIAAQFPKLPTPKDAVADYDAAAKQAIAAYGETMSIAQGTDSRVEHPVDSLARISGRPGDITVIAARKLDG